MTIGRGLTKEVYEQRSKASRRNIRILLPVIPLERPERNSSPKKGTGPRTFKLHSQPENENSQTYELTVPHFRTGTPEEWLLCKRNINTVITGQNITTGPESYAMARRILDGDALTAFELATTTRGNQSVANFRACLNDVTQHIFPRRALVLQKRWMRYYLRKDEDMSVREYVGRVVEMNNLLEQFLPFHNNQKLPDEEIKEVF